MCQNSNHARPPVEKKLKDMVEQYIKTLHPQHLDADEAVTPTQGN